MIFCISHHKTCISRHKNTVLDMSINEKLCTLLSQNIINAKEHTCSCFLVADILRYCNSGNWIRSDKTAVIYFVF